MNKYTILLNYDNDKLYEKKIELTEEEYNHIVSMTFYQSWSRTVEEIYTKLKELL